MTPTTETQVASPEVVADARDRLRSLPYPALKRLNCAYGAGVLKLQGRVSSFYLKQLAQEAVSALHGVHSVVNEIEVAEGSRRKRRLSAG
jgi:osmotically-inducible protein OsmY